MKIIFFLLVFAVTVGAQAQAESALETDDTFFKEATAPYEDDELDRVHKKNELQKTSEFQKKNETKVKDEVSSTTQGVMSAHEARLMDEKIVAENKRRQAAIMASLRGSTPQVYGCVAKNPKDFKGSHATVIWMVDHDGKILDTAIKSSDIENMEIQKCIETVASRLDFSTARSELLKKSQVEYTYKFQKKIKSAATAKKSNARRPASVPKNKSK